MQRSGLLFKWAWLKRSIDDEEKRNVGKTSGGSGTTGACTHRGSVHAAVPRRSAANPGKNERVWEEAVQAGEPNERPKEREGKRMAVKRRGGELD